MVVVFVRGLRRRRVEAGRVVAERVGGWNSAEADRGVCVCVWKETDGCKVEGWWVDAESWRVKAGRAEVVREGWGAVHIAAPYRLSAQAAHVPSP